MLSRKPQRAKRSLSRPEKGRVVNLGKSKEISGRSGGPSGSGAAGAPGASETAQTIIRLRQQLDTLEKREAFIQKKILAQVKDAKAKQKAGDRKGAIFALKRKKLYEKEVDKLNGARVTLETQIITLESASSNVETFKAMEAGAKAMQQVRGRLDVDDVDDIMDDIKEEMDISDQISEAIGRPIDGVYEDDDELLAELNALDEAELEEKLLGTPAVAGKMKDVERGDTIQLRRRTKPLPDVPVAPPEEDLEDAALKELQRDMQVKL